jgi:altronate hydrolase
MTETAQAAIPQFFRVAQEDDVAVALTPLESGQSVEIDGQAITLRDAIPRGHKFALHPIAAGERVHRYRAPIGLATAPIAAGEHVHSHNLRTGLSGEVTYTASDHPAARPPASRYAAAPAVERRFEGYMRPDGRVGTRNEIWILPTVGCVGRLGERLASKGEALFAGRIDGINAFNHPFGCSQLGADLDGTAAILAALAQNPNAGGVLLLGLGCESNQLDGMLARIPPSAASACGSCAPRARATSSPQAWRC